MTRDCQNYDAIIKTPFPGSYNRLAIRAEQEALQELRFVSDTAPLKPPVTPTAKQVVEQLNAYFVDPGYQFSVPLAPHGTAYQKRIWNMLRRCPSGKVWSYGMLAEKVNSGARAVGNACRRNPIPIMVPCHRVISVNGVGGYAGKTSGSYLKIKQWLLQHESVI